MNDLPLLFLNQTHGGNWVILKLNGDTSNRSAIGARVTIEAGGHKQSREIRSSSSFYSTSGLRLHFGLGKAENIDALVVSWPSGNASNFSKVAAN